MLKRSKVIRKSLKVNVSRANSPLVNDIKVNTIKVKPIDIRRVTVTNRPIIKKTDIDNDRKYKKLMNLLK